MNKPEKEEQIRQVHLLQAEYSVTVETATYQLGTDNVAQRQKVNKVTQMEVNYFVVMKQTK
jgi:hypothetical protein